MKKYDEELGWSLSYYLYQVLLNPSSSMSKRKQDTDLDDSSTVTDSEDSSDHKKRKVHSHDLTTTFPQIY